MSNTLVHIGVATTIQPKSRETKHGRVNRPAMQYVRLADNAHKQGAVLYLFHPHQVDWLHNKVQAWVPEHAGHPYRNWVKQTIRLPHVIYENVFVHLSIKGYTSKLRQEALKRNIPLFNPVLPGKWRMVEILKRSGMTHVTPATERLRSVDQLKQRLASWKTAYVKPIGGYGGMDVNRVEWLGSGQYRIAVDRTKSQTGQMRITVGDAELARWVLRKRKTPHLIQRGLNLMSVGNRRLDFRVVVHRDWRGAWQVIGIVPKMAAVDGVVTNIIAGGERIDMEQIVERARREGKEIPVAKLEEDSKRIAQILSNRFRNVGLIGFDMAVEENGQVSMIEMNPKPARSLLSKPMLERLAVHTVGFALYLAKP